MPFPLAHSLAGATIHVGLGRDEGLRPTARLAAAVMVANAPDLDLLPGILIGDPNRFHHGWTHSFLTAVIVGALAALLFGRTRGWRCWTPSGPGAIATGAVVALLWASHVGLDLVTEDARVPLGVPALWPLSEAHFYLGGLFARGERLAGVGTPAQFLQSLVSMHNLRALGREALLMGPVLVAVALLRRFRRQDG